MGPPGTPGSQAAAEILIGPCLSPSVFHPCIGLCGMIKVSITADSWHVGAEGLITMLVFMCDRQRESSNTEREDEKPKRTATEEKV